MIRRLLCGTLVVFLSYSFDIPFSFSQANFTRHTISHNLAGAFWVTAQDVNLDGRLDLVTSAADGLDWWDNARGFRRNFVAGMQASWSVYADDFDGDGDIDIVGGSNITKEIAVFEKAGGGGYIKYSVETNYEDPESIYAADLDGDGDQDIISCAVIPGHVNWWEKSGNNYTKHLIDGNLVRAHSVYPADLDKDGDIDIIASGTAESRWYENDGNGNFIARNFGFNGSLSVYAADLDGDGDRDILRTNRNNGNVEWFENDGFGRFTGHLIEAAYGDSWSAVAGDIDGDGDLDVVAAGFASNNIKAWFNNGNGGFGAGVVIENVNRPRYVFISDLDNDGDGDIAAAIAGDGDLVWYEVEGSPIVQESIIVTAPNGGESLQAGSTFEITWTSSGDVGNVKLEYSINSGESWNTIISDTENDGSYNWTIPNTPSEFCLLQISETANSLSDISNNNFEISPDPNLIPIITSFDPLSGTPGTEVTIFGSHFSGTSTVLFNDVTSIFTVDSDNLIRATVPQGSSTGSIKVTNPSGTTVSNDDFVVLQQYTVTVIVLPPESGAVTIEPDKQFYDDGEIVNLTAESNSGFRFLSWTGDVGSVNKTITFVMEQNRNITANFLTNAAPIANADSVTISEGESVEIDILSNDHDSDSKIDTSSVKLVDFPSGGTAVVNQTTGSITYTTNLGFVGTDTFSYQVFDEFGAPSNNANVTVTVSSLPRQAFSFFVTYDSHVNSDSRNFNYGNNQSLRVSPDGYSSYFKFNVEGVSGAVVRAVIRLNVVQGGTHGGEVYVTRNFFRKSNLSWNEDELTYRNAPVLLGRSLSEVDGLTAGEVVEVDVTKAVHGDGEISFCIRAGVCVRPDCYSLVEYGSKESLTPPQLIVESLATSDNNFVSRSGVNEEVMAELLTLELPNAYELRPNYPNPFNLETNIEYTLPHADQVRILIYNIRGQVVRYLIDSFESSGVKTLRWNGRNDFGNEVASGLYFVGLEIGETKLIRKMSLQK